MTHNMVSKTNNPNFYRVRQHDHEDADTLLIVLYRDVAKIDPFSECGIISPDTHLFFTDLSFPRTDTMNTIPNWSRRSFV